MKVVFYGKQGQFFKATNAVENAIAKTNTNAIRWTAGKMMDAARGSVAQAGFGKEWQKSFLFAMRPKRGTALNPWAWLHSSLNFASIFETGGTINPVKRNWIWLPLPTVPFYKNTGRGRIPLRQMTPKVYVEQVGPLKYVGHRFGKAPLLLGLLRTTAASRQWLWANKPKKHGLGNRSKKAIEQWVPMFVGVDQVTISKKFNVTPAMISASKSLGDNYSKALESAKREFNIQDG